MTEVISIVAAGYLVPSFTFDLRKEDPLADITQEDLAPYLRSNISVEQVKSLIQTAAERLESLSRFTAT